MVPMFFLCDCPAAPGYLYHFLGDPLGNKLCFTFVILPLLQCNAVG